MFSELSVIRNSLSQSVERGTIAVRESVERNGLTGVTATERNGGETLTTVENVGSRSALAIERTADEIRQLSVSNLSQLLLVTRRQGYSSVHLSKSRRPCS